MKAIMLMFDSLNREMLAPYGCDWTHTPNFARLAKRSVQFDRCYAGSLPCMPARRELHTGRYNFLHRSWGPLEPFDDSVPQMLKNSGVYTHLVSDHIHYWEDGGASYHNRYSSWEIERGQEGDKWKCLPELFDPMEEAKVQNDDGRYFYSTRDLQRHDAANRAYMQKEEDTCLARTFSDGMEFLDKNGRCDNWFLQIECFDPHEPFFSPCAYQAQYPHDYDGPAMDWPPYHHVTEDAQTQKHLKLQYASLMTMCDAYLGRLLDKMDALDLWKDTLLIVNTDHGYLLGEHGWWSKVVMPCYDEIVHLPLFIHDPRSPEADGQRRQALVQSIDLAATLLEYFGLAPTPDMQGRSVRPVIQSDQPIRDYVLFGIHGGHVNVSDGRYVYMKAPANADNQPLYEYTLMPMHMRSLFGPEELRSARLVPEGFSFTKNCPVLRIPKANGGNGNFSDLLINGKDSEAARHIDNNSLVNAANFGDKLFDLETDPHEEQELTDSVLEARMANLLVRAMEENDSPAEQFQRLGLPRGRAITPEDIQSLHRQEDAGSQPEILTGRAWTKGGVNTYRALMRFIPEDQRSAAARTLSGAVSAEHPDGEIDSKAILDQLEKVVPQEYLAMIYYFVDLAGRTK